MNKIEKMIADMCPNGVEWKELGEVVGYDQPTKYIVESTEYDSSYSVPVLTAGQTFILGYTDEKDGIYNASKTNPVIIFDDFTTSFHWVDFEFKIKSSAMKILYLTSDSCLFRYVYHFMGTINHNVGEHGRQWIGKYSKIKIPIPPVVIQEEIVKILDKMTEHVTELTSELTSELTKRTKQYEYYRENLLTFEDHKVEWKTLGEVCDVRDGTHDSPKKQLQGKFLITSKNIKKGNVTFDGAYFISEEDYININKRSKVDVDDLLFTMIGTVGEVAHIQKVPDYAIKNIGLIKTGNYNFSRYLFHYLQTNQAKRYIDNNRSKGSQEFLALGKLRDFPVPKIQESIQNKIVYVLDNFEKVCNDLNIGLPKEIELRQKEYEYYREKLLTFDSISAKHTHTHTIL